MKVKKVAVIYTEGETDLLFYKNLFQHIKSKNGNPNSRIEFINVKGVGKFASKVCSKYKNEICTKYQGFEHNLFFAYDTDVFELNQKPPIDWIDIEAKIKLIKSPNIIHLQAKKMIEDWFIFDIEGICKNLKINIPKKLKGNTGYEKIQFLFRTANRIYQKGYNSNNFIGSLDFSKIYPQINGIIKPFKNKLYS